MTALEMDRAAEVMGLLNEIVDPCSNAAGVPLGLRDMGIVQRVDVDGGDVRVHVLPTFPGCRFVPIFELEIETRVASLEWVEHVTVAIAPATDVWDESRMTQTARLKLLEKRVRTTPS